MVWPSAWLALVQRQQEQEQKLEAPGMALARALPPQNQHQSCPTHRCPHQRKECSPVQQQQEQELVVMGQERQISSHQRRPTCCHRP